MAEQRDGFCDCGAAVERGTNICRTCAIAAATARIPATVRDLLDTIADNLGDPKVPHERRCRNAHRELRRLLEQQP